MWRAVLLVLIFALPANAHLDQWDAIGRLMIDGRFACTAFVVRSAVQATRDYENYVVSAGHCYHGPSKSYRFSSSERMVDLTRYVGSSPGHLHDLLVMAFRSREAVPALETLLGARLALGQDLTFAGHTDRASMSVTAPLVDYTPEGHLLVDAVIARGNSGSPVTLPGTRQVIGVVVRYTVLVPVGESMAYCVLNPCPPYAPYWTTKIDHIREVARDLAREARP